MNESQAASAVDFFDHDTGDFDVVEYYENEDLQRMLREGRKRKAMEDLGGKNRKEFMGRNSRPRKDKRSSHWYIDYVLDAQGMYNNPDNRDGKVFRFRFGLDKAQVWDIVKLLREENS